MELELTDTPNGDDIAVLDRGLAEFYSGANTGGTDRPIAIFVRDPQGTVVACLSGKTGWDQLYISVIFVSEPLRRSGVGTALMERAEQEGKARGCLSAWLMTSNPLAQAFYERRGYQVFGSVERRPPSPERYFLKKRL